MREILFLILVLSGAFVHAEGGGHGGNGGGGVYRNGRYMTFYTAGFYAEPVELEDQEIPELTELIEWWQKFPLLGESTRAKFIENLMISSNRHYYRVKPEVFTPEVRRRLIEEYSRIMKTPEGELALFAITDTANGNTYLFPEFNSLNKIEKWAVLYHEAFWLANRTAIYREVIDSEIAFQAQLEKPDSLQRTLSWLGTVSSRGEVLRVAIHIDLLNGYLGGLLRSDEIALFNLFGEQYFECIKENADKCESFIRLNVSKLRKANPKSFFLRFFEESMASGFFSIVKSGPRPSYDNGEGCGKKIVKKGWLDLDEFKIGFKPSDEIPVKMPYVGDFFTVNFGVSKCDFYALKF